MKKTMNIVVEAISWVLLAVSLFMMVFTILSVRTFDRLDRKLFGYSAFIVVSDSMSATDFSAGDLVLSKAVDPRELVAGDIITFQSQDPDSFGKIITHKIRSLTYDENGNPGFVTYGTTTNADDPTVVTYGQIIGKYALHLAGVGKFFQFMKSTPGYFCCIFVPFMLLIISQAINVVKLFRQYKGEQMAEIKAEQEKLAAEREESQRLLRELAEMKNSMNAQTAAPTYSSASFAQPPSAPAMPTPTVQTPSAPVKSAPASFDYQPSEEEIQAFLAKQAAIKAAAEKKLAEMKQNDNQ